MSEKHTPGPWKCDEDAHGIWAPSEKGGETKIFDIRGWGYLTGQGHGALGLSPEKATAIQHANGRMAAAAPDMLEALKAADASLLHAGWREDAYPRTVMQAAIAKAEGG